MKNLSFEGTNIYVGLDVHHKSWTATIMTDNLHLKTMSVSPVGTARFVSFLKRTYPGANFICAYEAGYCGFWIQEELALLGVKTLVIHPADLPTTDKERRYKTDPRDSRKIAMALRGGFLKSIYVPEKQMQMDRSIVRHRHRIHRDVQRSQIWIRAHLGFFGPPPSEEEIGKYWSRKMIGALEKKAELDKDVALSLLLRSLHQKRQVDLEALRAVRALSREERHCKNVELLCSIPGVGTLTAMVFLTEIGDVSRFRCDELHSYIGLIPGSQSSGEKEVKTGITKRGNKFLRTALVQSSWVAVRVDPEMALCYEQLCKRMKGQKAIIRIAKKQANRMRSVLLRQNRFKRMV